MEVEQNFEHPIYVTRLLTGLRELKGKEFLSDLTVRVQGREFKVHKSVLAIFSDYWNAMFSSPMKEQTQDTITLKDSDNITAEAFQIILQYYYTGELLLTANNVSEIFKASAVMCDFQMIENCVQFITETFLRDQHKQRHEEREIKLEDYLKYLKMFEAYYSLPELKELVLKSIAQFFSLLCDTDDFLLNLSYEHLSAILERNELASSSEQNILQRVVFWISADVNRNKYSPQLIKKVRLGIIPVSDVDRILNESGLIQNKEILQTHHELLRYHSINEKALYLENPSMFTSRQCKNTLVAINTIHGLKYYDADRCEWMKFTKSNNSKQWSSVCSTVVTNDQIFVGGGCWLEEKWRGSGRDRVISQENIYGADFVSYNIGNKKFETLPNMLRKRCQFPMVYLDGYIYAIGGYDGGILNGVERFNLKTKTWQKIASLNYARSQACAVIKDGCIYVIGGNTPSRLRHSSSNETLKVEQFIPKLNEWKVCGSTFTGHVGAVALVLDGQIYVGGSTPGGPCELVSFSSKDSPAESTKNDEGSIKQDLISDVDKNAKLFRIGEKVFFNLNGFCYESDLVVCSEQVYDVELGKWQNVFSECGDKSSFAIVSAVIDISK